MSIALIKEMILDGGVDEINTPRFCAQIAACFSGNKAVVIEKPVMQNEVPRVCSFGVDAQHVSSYEAHFCQFDPMNNATKTQSAIKMSEVISKARFEKSVFFNEFFKVMDSYHSLSITTTSANSTAAIEIAINRGLGQSDFCAQDKRQLETIANLIQTKLALDRLDHAVTHDERAAAFHKLAGLSARELDIFCHIVSGHSAQHYAEEKNISVLTVRDHLKRIREKLDLSSQLEFAAFARIANPPRIGD